MARAKGVSLAFIAALYICAILGAGGATFEIQNNCLFTVWAAGSPGGGKRLESGRSWTLQVPTNTSSGRFWGRTGCSFNSSGQGSCKTGDCKGLLNCQGYGANPVTLFEYTFGQNDFYDISLVDGFNLPMSIKPSNSSCQAIACSSNITASCPSEFRVSDGCQNACANLEKPRYCCTGNYSNDCGPTYYSEFFKGQCPQAYSYAYDDANSTFTCSGGNNYKVIFCGGNATSLQGFNLMYEVIHLRCLRV